MSARTGEGFAGLCEFLEQRGEFGRRVLEVDYDVYAAGEAELGWLNSQVAITAARPFALDDLLVDVVRRLQVEFAQRGAETAHLKAIGMWEGVYAVANLVSSFTEPELSLDSRCRVPRAEIVVNARVSIDPAELDGLVRAAVAAAGAAVNGEARFQTLQSFRPGRPVPTHRLLEATASD
jgi:hypothetical protein